MREHTDTHTSVRYRTVGGFDTAHSWVPSDSGCLHQCGHNNCPRKRATAYLGALPGLRLTPPLTFKFRFGYWWV
jgi:hypothetical protein